MYHFSNLLSRAQAISERFVPRNHIDGSRFIGPERALGLEIDGVRESGSPLTLGKAPTMPVCGKAHRERRWAMVA